jgi:hypothetical protein
VRYGGGAWIEISVGSGRLSWEEIVKLEPVTALSKRPTKIIKGKARTKRVIFERSDKDTVLKAWLRA